MWTNIKTNLLTILEKNVPSKITSSKNHQPWITIQTKRLIRQKQRWFQKAKNCNSEKVWKKYKEIKKNCQKLCRNTHLSYVQNLVTNDKNNKKLWAYIKSKNNENSGISDLFHENKLIQDPTSKANLFNDHFCQIFSNPLLNQHSEPSIKENQNSIPNITVKKAGVLKLLLNLNVNKATGPDGIPGRLLKLCAHEIADVLTHFFQASLDQGSLPTDWKQANIVPLHKKDDKTKVSNYRPISLTSKILEHIVHSNIINFLEDHSILSNIQHGFRKNRAANHNLSQQ